MSARELVVQFNADVADGMPWKFVPTQREVRVKPGESTLAFYTAENRSSAPVTGVSTYNVTPMKVGIQVNIKSFIDPTKIVGVGRINSLNPLDKVGGHEIGPNWCEVIVIVPMDWDEHLIRPYQHFKTIADVVGVSIAWPQALVFPEED